ncbi:MAG: biosynthetic arginine decarboxylase [Phycisphaerales bacterium]
MTSAPAPHPDRATIAADQCHTWTASDSATLYRVPAWSGGYFQTSACGTLQAMPEGPTGPGIDIKDVIAGLSARGIDTPVLLRFSGILEHRLRSLRDAFQNSMTENDYKGNYIGVYPIKVNQQSQVVNEIRDFGHALGFGLEVGSKPELLAVMAMTIETPEQPIICNGFKDARYIEAVILATKLGRRIIPVVENVKELRLIIHFAEKHGVTPTIGVRVKLASGGSGRWADSVGIKSKFGLSISELLEAVKTLSRHDMLDCLQLLHCHSGSQLQDIGQVKRCITELAHVYVQLKQTGAGLTMLDVGGGLAVDYQGSQTNSPSSMNYSLDEYASDIVYRIASVCNAAGVEHPTIVTECGRAMVAHSSVLVFDVLGSTGPSDLVDRDLIHAKPGQNEAQPIRDLRAAISVADQPDGRLVECYHDAERAREEALTLFSLGYMTLEDRALTERLFWTTCSIVQAQCDGLEHVPESLADINDLMCENYFCNFSLFQSLPDTWAIDQLFPIMPIHRLDEEPLERAVLADITCDSDGKIDCFIGQQGKPARTLPVHGLNNDSYYLGVFLVGAYQETLGDLHNLFGDAHAVHIGTEDGNWFIDEIVKGDSIHEVLSYVQYEPDALSRQLERECERAVRRGAMSVPESRILITFYDEGLKGYTYLDPDAELT